MAMRTDAFAIACFALAFSTMSGAAAPLPLRPEDTDAARQARRPRRLSRQGDARRQCRELLWVHAAVQRARSTAPRNEGQGVRGARLSEQRLRRTGAGYAEEIATFCKRTYDVTFPMFSKVVTRAGPRTVAGLHIPRASGHLPAWNFAKYVIGKDGRVRRVLSE